MANPKVDPRLEAAIKAEVEKHLESSGTSQEVAEIERRLASRIGSKPLLAKAVALTDFVDDFYEALNHLARRKDGQATQPKAETVDTDGGVYEDRRAASDPMQPERGGGAASMAVETASARQAQQAPIPNSKGQGRKRGPKPDYDTAARVAEVVTSVAPDGDWRSKLNDICDQLDEEKIPIPSTWRRNRDCRSWSGCIERPVVIKAIEYRLATANQRKRISIPETFS